LSLRTRVLAARHDDDIVRLVLGTRTLFAAREDLAHDSAEKVTIRRDDASAGKCFLLTLAHIRILAPWQDDTDEQR
jgi:hypothetical protein